MNLVTAPPKSTQVALFLKQEIESGKLKPGEKLASVRSLAEKFGIGRQVVLSAFDILGKENLIIKEVGRGTFINPDINKTKRLRVGFWINEQDISLVAYKNLHMSICRRATILNHDVVLGSATDNTNLETWLSANKFDGLILSGMITDTFIRQVKKTGLPFVVFGNYELEEQVCRIETDLPEVLKKAVIQAIDNLNVNHIGFICGSRSFRISREIEENIREAIDNRQLKVLTELFRFSEEEDGYKEMKYLMENTAAKPDLLYVTKQAFYGVAKYLYEKNIVNNNRPKLIISDSNPEEYPYSDLIDIKICNNNNKEFKTLDVLLNVIEPESIRPEAKILVGHKITFREDIA